jgi:hypothetical protein
LLAFLQTVRTDSSGLLRTSTISSGFCHGFVPVGFLLPNFLQPPLFLIAQARNRAFYLTPVYQISSV